MFGWFARLPIALPAAMAGLLYQAAAVPPLSWSESSLFAPDSFYDVTVAPEGILVAGGNHLRFTQDRTNWHHHFLSGNATFLSTAYGKGRWVATGYSGLVAFSSNGRDWNIQNLGEDFNLFALIHDGNRFLSVGGYGQLATSSSGDAWQVYGDIAQETLFDIHYSDGKYITVGKSGLYLSTDGFSWTWKDTGEYQTLGCAAYGHGYYLAAGQHGVLVRSTDGEEWTREEFNINFYKLRPIQNGWLALDSFGDMHFSTDGRHWLAMYDNIATGWNGFASEGETIWACGASALLARTSDLQEYTLVETMSPFWNDLAASPSRLIMTGGNGSYLTSQDRGTTWERVTEFEGTQLNAIAAADNGWLLAGNGGFLWHSEDGQNWSRRSAGTTNHLNDVVKFNGEWFVAGNQGTLRQSTETLFWSDAGAGVTTDLRRLAASPSRLMAIGSQTALSRTASGPWQIHDLPLGEDLITLIYGGGRFVAGGESGRLIASQDGQDWTSIPSPTTDAIQAMAHGNGLFLIATTGGGYFFSEADWNWKPCLLPNAALTRFLHFNGERFEAFPDYHLKWSSGDLSIPWLSLDKEGAASAGIRIHGAIGSTYEIESSGDFSGWSSISTNTLQQPSEQIAPIESGTSPRFFRALLTEEP